MIGSGRLVSHDLDVSSRQNRFDVGFEGSASPFHSDESVRLARTARR